jgi:hypothetical protein
VDLRAVRLATEVHEAPARDRRGDTEGPVIASPGVSATLLLLAGALCMGLSGAALLMYSRRIGSRHEGEPVRAGENASIPARAWPAFVLGLVLLAIGVTRLARG